MTEQKTHHHLYKCLGQVVNKRRKSMKMSQQDLAEAAGLDRTFISNIEQGSRNPSFRSIAHIAHGLKLRFSRLVGECEQCMRRCDEDAA